MTQVLAIDARGRLRLPDDLRAAAHIQTPGELCVRVRPEGLLLCSRPAELPEEVAQLAALDGPVDAWDVLEEEIESQHSGGPME